MESGGGSQTNGELQPKPSTVPNVESGNRLKGWGFPLLAITRRYYCILGIVVWKTEELGSGQNCLLAQSGSRLNLWPAQADLPCKGKPISLGAWIHKGWRKLTMALGNGGKKSTQSVLWAPCLYIWGLSPSATGNSLQSHHCYHINMWKIKQFNQQKDPVVFTQWFVNQPASCLATGRVLQGSVQNERLLPEVGWAMELLVK